ncbi:MAG: hypothetical protein ACU0BZ_03265 [Paracoccus sp. (in: a-proteobacteria)]|jgi:hypothetical protein|uniref:hypothetical protein n=1 Tax=Paracoccus sp. TaxID=267 RepID=UPI000C686547|nr:hypothetical protein [Paracoccus sp. (in: a-proteobacteria)]MAN56676.1 hypothetical protein [Paracoccus sp. (in: a-proteobacteria)]MBA49343.1 hypothetical protein [Paracoccus sp. (in: a-proteobacteria)]|tara:strand:+ start:3073 stop:4434 length:1362 start_codon:yes stop_codon:yes gene_type:complete
MKPRHGTARPGLIRSAAPLFLLALLPTAAANAQTDDQPAAIARFSIGQQLALDNGDVIGVTPLDLTFRRATRSQTLDLGLSLPLTEGDPKQTNFIGFGDRQARLSYRRFARNASLEAGLNYRETDLDREIFFDQDTGTLVTLDPGSVTTTSARLGYAFGSQAKLGGEFSLEYSRRAYSGTTDPDLVDSRTGSLAGRIYLEPTPLIRARIVAGADRTDSAGGGTDSRISQLGAGASLQVSKAANLDLETTWTDIRRVERDTGLSRRARGVALRLNGSLARPAGEYTLAFSSEPDTAGRREDLLLGRSIRTPRYDLSFALGATRFAGSIDPIFQAGYARDLGPVSDITASLSRVPVVDNDGNEAINTNFEAAYSRQFDEISSLSGSIRYRESQVQSGDALNAKTFAISIDYSRALTADLSLNAGYTMVRGKSGDGSRNDDERLFLGINRSFDFLP